MTVVSDKVGSALNLARQQMNSFEKQLVVVEKKAMTAATSVRTRVTEAVSGDLPQKLEKALDSASGLFERGLARVSHLVFGELFDRLDALEKKVDALSKKKAPKKAAAHS